MAGLLLLPAGDGTVPGVVLVGGSGPSDRDGNGFFPPLSQSLNRGGIAVLSYDKRGVGRSEGRWQPATVEDLAADAYGALAFLRGQPRVAPARVTLFGHSEGGWVALRACRSAEPPALAIFNPCPAVSLLDAEVFALEAAGCPPEDAAKARSLILDLATSAGAGDDLSSGIGLVARASGHEWFAHLATAGFELTPAFWAQIRAWGTYDPEPDLSRLTVPTVALLGAEDHLVPVQASIETYDKTARHAGRTQVSRVFPGANHRMALGDGGELAPGYLSCVRELCANAGSDRA